MSQQKPIHYRLVGAVILVLAAVLILPWLFDGAGYETVQGLEHPVPERPVFVEPHFPPVQSSPAAVMQEVGDPDGETPRVAASEAPAVPPSSVASASSLAPRVNPPAVSASPIPPRQEVREAASPGSGWAVQVGSYIREVNARDQVAQLRALDLPAFVEQTRIDGRATWRVKVGPSPQREQALRLRDEIRARTDVNGIVLPHP